MTLWGSIQVSSHSPGQRTVGLDLKDPIFFVGIGGCGMSALAELAKARGLDVRGSDKAAGATIDKLKKIGIPIASDHSASSVKDVKTVVYSTAIPKDNPELRAAKEAGIPILHRSEMLAELMSGHQAITIAGTHGKTTTSAMIAHVFDSLGLDPTVALGGRMRRYGSPSRFGKGDLFVAEADESDGSFLRYKPYVAVLTNVAPDHMDFFKTDEELAKAFLSYLNNTDADGSVVLGWDNAVVRDIGHRTERTKLTYGFVIGCDVRGLDYSCKGGETIFRAVVERDVVTCRLPAFGKHNIQNALCAIAVARALELNVSKAAEALSDFSGVERRMATIHNKNNVTILDDYAHNPGKIAACISGIKEAWPERTLHVIYQAHRFSRLETMFDSMLDALEGADHVYVVPVYSAGEQTSQDFSPARLASEMRKRSSRSTIACASFQEAVDSVKNMLSSPAIVLTVGAGDVWKIGEQLREDLA